MKGEAQAHGAEEGATSVKPFSMLKDIGWKYQEVCKEGSIYTVKQGVMMITCVAPLPTTTHDMSVAYQITCSTV